MGVAGFELKPNKGRGCTAIVSHTEIKDGDTTPGREIADVVSMLESTGIVYGVELQEIRPESNMDYKSWRQPLSKLNELYHRAIDYLKNN